MHARGAIEKLAIGGRTSNILTPCET